MHIIQNACNLRYKDAYTLLHMPCQMQEMHQGNNTYATKELPHKTHKPPAPRGEAKRVRHHRQKSKGAQNSQAPPKLMH
jgi:hypothetical protein